MPPTIKETIHFAGLRLDFLLDGEDTGQAMVMFEMTVDPHARVPAPHFHVEVDEVLYGLEGTLTQLVGGETRQLTAGDKCFIKRGTVHGFTNTSDSPAKVLCILTPASISPAYFREIAAVVNVGGPPDMQKVLAIMKQYGLEPVKPA